MVSAGALVTWAMVGAGAWVGWAVVGGLAAAVANCPDGSVPQAVNTSAATRAVIDPRSAIVASQSEYALNVRAGEPNVTCTAAYVSYCSMSACAGSEARLR